MERRLHLSAALLCAFLLGFSPALRAEEEKSASPAEVAEEEATAEETKEEEKPGKTKDEKKAEKKPEKSSAAAPAEKPHADREKKKHDAHVAMLKKEREKKQERLMAEWRERDKHYQRAAAAAEARGEKPPEREPMPDFSRPAGKVDPIELRDGYYKGDAAYQDGKIEVIVRTEDGCIRQVWTSAPDSGVRSPVIRDLEQQVIRKNGSVIPGVETCSEEFTKQFSAAVEKALGSKNTLEKKPSFAKRTKKPRSSKKR